MQGDVKGRIVAFLREQAVIRVRSFMGRDRTSGADALFRTIVFDAAEEGVIADFFHDDTVPGAPWKIQTADGDWIAVQVIGYADGR